MKKQVLSVGLALVMLFSVVSVPAKVLASSVETKEITILHTNDVHGRAEENEKNGEIGYAKVKAYADSLANAILLDGGDTFHGTTFATISRGESIVNIMNEMGYVAMAAGNHDFNYGYPRLKELAKMAKFPVLAANVMTAAGQRDLGDRLITEVNGVKIGIFGLATDETQTKSNPLNTQGLTFLDNVEVAKAQVKALKEEGAQVVVAVVHLGIDEASVNKSTDLAQKVEGIDVIVDGHSHTALPTGKMVNKTLIVQTGGHLNQLGQVKLQVKGGEVVTKSATLLDYDFFKKIEPDKEILAKIAAIQEANKPYLEKVVGKARVDLEGLRENVRTGETNLGNLLTDSMREISGADVAITNGGGIRASIGKGDVTMGQILTSFPFTNYPVKLEVTGKTILEALEYGVDAAPEEAGKFPHVSGMTFKYDPKQEKGHRVFDLLVDGKALELEKTYTLVTNDFMAIGGDGYEMFKPAKKLAEYPLLSEVLAKYMEEKKEVAPVVEGRIIKADKPVEKPEDKPGDKNKFTDIQGHWAEKYILEGVEKSHFKGMTETSFEPDTKISRAMLVTTLARLSGQDEAQKIIREKTFTDVKEGQWYSNAVDWAVANDLVKGYEDGTFKPSQEVTREEMATILGRYIERSGIPVNKMRLQAFVDQDKISDWAQAAIATARNAGIMEGRDGNIFDPKGQATRAELAKVIYELDVRIDPNRKPLIDDPAERESEKVDKEKEVRVEKENTNKDKAEVKPAA